MGRLKKDHSGYKTSGIWTKYQMPSVSDKPKSGKHKKDTNKWCRGKVGAQHDWNRYQGRHYDWFLDDYVSPYIEIVCQSCGKRKYAKTAKTADYRLHLWVENNSKGYELVGVRVNGELLPTDELKYKKGKYWCNDCGHWH